MIHHNKERFDKEFLASHEEEGIVHHQTYNDIDAEQRGLVKMILEKKMSMDEYRNTSILYRTNKEAVQVSDLLITEKIPFWCTEPIQDKYDHWIYRDILSYHKLGNGIGNKMDLNRILNHPQRFLFDSRFFKTDGSLKQLMHVAATLPDGKWKRSKAMDSVEDMFYLFKKLEDKNPVDGEKLKGSGRTYGNIHLKNQVLDPCKEYFFAYGGHAGAAGMTIPEKNLMLFRNKVRKLDIPVLYREKRILYDLEVTKEEIPELYEKMEFFAPFGEGNPEPVFFIRNLELSPVRGTFYEQNGSDGKSIKLFTMPYPSSGYQMAAEYLLMDAPKKIDMTFEVYTIYSHGKEHRRLRMLDFCASKNAETETSFKKELSAMLNFM